MYDACFRELCRDSVVEAARYTSKEIAYLQYEAIDPSPWGAEEAYQLIWKENFSKHIFCAGRISWFSWRRTGT